MRFFIIIPIVLLALIGGISLYLQPNDFIGCHDQPIAGGDRCIKADAIVVVSGGNTQARTDEGIRLYDAGWANSLVFSGAAKDKTGLSNAAAMREQAIAEGVPSEDIYIEELSENTAQNAQNTQSIIEHSGFENIILVTSGYHQRRASLEFERLNSEVTVLNHPLLNDSDWSFWWWMTPRGWWLAGGEIAKIVAFYIEGNVQ